MRVGADVTGISAAFPDAVGGSVTETKLSPLHWVPEHDDEASIGLQGVDEVLDEEGRLSFCGVVIEIYPGVVIPHGGRAGFSCRIHPQWFKGEKHRDHRTVHM